MDTRTSQRGFTLVEMMIAVTLGLIILAALTTFFVQSSQNRTELDRNSRQIENGRYALDQVREDLMLAGFYSDLYMPSTTTWSATAACTTDPTTLSTYWVTGPYATTDPTMPTPVFGYAAGATLPGCLANYQAGTDVLVIRRFNTEPTAPGTQVAGQYYVQQSECSTDNVNTPFKYGLGTATFDLHKLDCSTVADLWRYREQVYYVRSCSVCGTDNIPTLVRLELDNGAMNVVPLVEGIQDFRVDYGLDTGFDGTIDAWTHCDTSSPCTPALWGNVVAARVYVLARNLDASPSFTDTKTYAMGLSGNDGPFNDGFKRHVYSAQVSMINRLGQREPSLLN